MSLSEQTIVKAYQLLAEYEMEQRNKAAAWANMGGEPSRRIRTPVAEAAYNRAIAIRQVLDELLPYAGSKPLVETTEELARCEAREPDYVQTGSDHP